MLDNEGCVKAGGEAELVLNYRVLHERSCFTEFISQVG